MKCSLLFIFSLIFFKSLYAQVPSCAGAYDTDFNNDYTSTHYFPGPMAIPLNANVNGRISNAGDIDYYKFTITNQGTIFLTLSNLPANYNLKLVNSLGNTLSTSARSGTSPETINFTVASNTVYYALVYPANNKTFNANACYTLRVSTGTASRPEPVGAEAPLFSPAEAN